MTSFGESLEWIQGKDFLILQNYQFTKKMNVLNSTWIQCEISLSSNHLQD